MQTSPTDSKPAPRAGEPSWWHRPLLCLGVCGAVLTAWSGLDGRPARAAEQGACAGATAESVVEVVQGRYENVDDLEARFEQQTRSVILGGGGLDEADPARGTVILAKPGRMRWHYETPAESIVVSDGETLWIYDVVGREVTTVSVTEGYLAGTALQFLLGDGSILASFGVRLLGCADGRAELELRPKAAASYERLGLTVKADDGQVVETTLYDLFGNETRVGFSRLRFNRKPEPETFRLEVPEGVEVNTLTTDGRSLPDAARPSP